MGPQTISKSNKKRYPAYYHPKEGKIINKRDEFPLHFKMIVEREDAGKNKKGKKLFTSRTRHVPA